MRLVFDFFQRHFKIVLAIIILLAVLMGIYVKTNLTLENNISKLLPQQTKEVKIMDNIGLLDQLLFDISLKDDEKNPQKLIQVADFLAEKLEKTSQFISVFYKVNPADFQQTLQKLYEKRFYLINLQDLSVKDFNNDVFIHQQLEKIKFKLLTFDSLVLKDFLLKDPLGIAEEGIRNLFKQNISYKAKMKNNVIFSEDEKHVLIITKPKEKSFNIDFSKDLLEQIHTIQQQIPEAQIKVLGGHVYALSAATMMKFDMTLISLLSTLAILLIDFLSFRRPKVLVISFIPTFFGLLAGTFAVAFFFQSVHGITLIFGSMLIGICIDYSTYYFISYAFEKDRFIAVTKVKNSLLCGYLTTLSVNIALFFSDFRFFREVAVFFTVGLSSAFFLALFILPQIQFKQNLQIGIMLKLYDRFLAFITKVFRNRQKTLAVGFMLLFAASAFIVSRIEFDSNIRNLNYTKPELKKIESDFLNRYGDISTSNMIISSGKTLQEALSKNDKVFALLKEAKDQQKIESYYNIHPFLPSNQAQQKNLEAILLQQWPQIEKKVQQNAIKLGFQGNAFDSFFQELADIKKNPRSYLSFDEIKDSPLFMIINEFVLHKDGEYLILSYFRSIEEGNKQAAVIEALKKLDPDIYYIHQVNLFNKIILLLKNELLKVMLISFFLISLIMFIYYRKLKKMLIIALPPFFSVFFALALTHLLGFKINIICLFSIVFIIGIGLDYAIFVLDNTLKGENRSSYTPMAVLIAAVCTILSFGSLIISKNTVLSSIGLIIFTGILSTVFFSILMIPFMVEKWIKKTKTA